MREREGTFITVGNAKQPFDRLFKMVEAVLDVLPEPIIIQAGSSSIQVEGAKTYKIMTSSDFQILIKTASVVIMHAGAGSLIHALFNGQKPIVIPRRLRYGEHIDDHQIQLARELAKQDRVYLVEDEREMRQVINMSSLDGEVGKCLETTPMVDKLEKLFKSICLEKNR